MRHTARMGTADQEVGYVHLIVDESLYVDESVFLVYCRCCACKLRSQAEVASEQWAESQIVGPAQDERRRGNKSIRKKDC